MQVKHAAILSTMCLALFVAGCANPGIVQMSPDTYMLARRDTAGMFGNAARMKAEVISEANAFAESKGKVAIAVGIRETPMAPGQLATIEYRFRLVNREPETADAKGPATLESVYAELPAYRIDNRLKRISIIGSGPDHEQLESALTKLLTERTEIKVVEPANLQSALAGKIIEYETGLAAGDAQTISQLLQIDHMLFFQVKMAPYDSYRHGGRLYAAVNLKIVNTLNGEVVFQASRNVGIRFDNPEKYGYKQINEGDSPATRIAAFTSLVYELRYALNDVALGFSLTRGTNVVSSVLVSSVADRAGVKKGDAIVGLNDNEIRSDQDWQTLTNTKAMRQGAKAILKIQRNGSISELQLAFPTIPIRSENKWERAEKGEANEPGEPKNRILGF